MSDKKIVIIGSGVFGLSSALHLAKAGYTNITVFDQGEFDTNDYSPLKGAYSASTDISKLIRALYVDKFHYQNLAIESLRQYYEWNKELLALEATLPGALRDLRNEALQRGDNSPLFVNTGYVRLDDYKNDEEAKNLKNFEDIGLRLFSYDANNPDDLERAKLTGWYLRMDPLGQRGKVKEWSSVLDSFAGVAYADKCLLWVRHLCDQTGNVKFKYGPQKGAVSEIIIKDGFSQGVATEDGVFHEADYVVVAAGGWTTKLLPSETVPRLECQGSSYVIVEISKDRKDLITKYENFPMINWRMTYELNYREDAVYMFPATRDGLLKIGLNDHYWRFYNSEKSDLLGPRVRSDMLPEKNLKYYNQFITQWLLDIAELGAKINFHKFCFSAVGQKNELVIDKAPSISNVVIASGGGFHGFKFLPVIGRFVEGAISGKQYEYSEKFRFGSIGEEKYVVEPTKCEHILNFAV